MKIVIKLLLFIIIYLSISNFIGGNGNVGIIFDSRHRDEVTDCNNLNYLGYWNQPYKLGCVFYDLTSNSRSEMKEE